MVTFKTYFLISEDLINGFYKDKFIKNFIENLKEIGIIPVAYITSIDYSKTKNAFYFFYGNYIEDFLLIYSKRIILLDNLYTRLNPKSTIFAAKNFPHNIDFMLPSFYGSGKVARNINLTNVDTKINPYHLISDKKYKNLAEILIPYLEEYNKLLNLGEL